MNTITTAATTYTPPSTSVVHNARVSLTDRSPASVVHVVQYDDTLPIVAVALTANGQAYTVPSGAAVNVRMRKPDGTYVYNPALGVSENAQTAYIAVTLQMDAVWGKSSPIIEIVIDGNVAATGAFTVIIDENPVPESAIESTDEYLTLYQILEQAQAAAQVVQENAQNLQNLTDNLTAVQNAAANAQAAAASAAAAQQAAQEALGFRTFFSAVTPDANGDLDPSRPMTTPTAASVTVKSKGDRIQSVQVNGFTNQAGTGDPSPNNVRQLTNGGKFFNATVYTGQENWSAYPGEANTFRAADGATIYSGVSSCYAGLAPGELGTKNGIYLSYTSHVIVTDLSCSSTEELKAKLQALYAAGTPLTVWYNKMVNGAEEKWEPGKTLYVPIIMTGGEYRCQCLELTAQLCDGDKVESCVPSGCDKAITVDGSTVTVTASGSNYVVTALNSVAGGNVYANGLAYLTLAAGQIVIPGTSFPTSVTSAQTANVWLQSNLQKVWYQSTAYTEANDISVQLEAHESAIVTVDGSDTLFTQGTDGYTVSLPNAANGAVICNRFSGLTAANNAVTISASQFPSSVTSLEQANTWAQSNPVTILYPLAAPAVYAHDPVTLVAVPYTAADVDAANQLANTPSTLPAIDSPDVPMLLDEAGTAQEETSAQPMSLAAPLASALPVAGTYIVSSQEGTTVAVSLKAFQDGGTPSVQALLNLVYPVGSIYMSATNVSPQVFLGGTWQQIQGQFLLAASSSYPAGSTGGEAAHALTAAENGPHTHNPSDLSYRRMYWDASGIGGGTFSAAAGDTVLNFNWPGASSQSGSGQPHNNMPPYLSVYTWQRIA